MDYSFWFPLFLSFRVAFFATLIVLIIGLPLAWVLAKKNFIGKSILDSILTLPLVLPPSVVGYYLLVTFGRQSTLGQFLENNLGITLVFTWYAAVLAASVVSMPLLINSAKAALKSVDVDLEDAARTMGRSELYIFYTITLPLASRGILAGVVMAFARALGDFGATLMIAGNIPNKTQTMPIAIWDAVQGGNMAQANFMVLVMTVFAIVVLTCVYRLEVSMRRGEKVA